MADLGLCTLASAGFFQLKKIPVETRRCSLCVQNVWVDGHVRRLRSEHPAERDGAEGVHRRPVGRRLPPPVLLVCRLPLPPRRRRQVPHRQRSHHLRRPRPAAAARVGAGGQAAAPRRHGRAHLSVTSCCSRQTRRTSRPDSIFWVISRR